MEVIRSVVLTMILFLQTCDSLIEPSLHHFPVPLVKDLKLHLVHITNNPAVTTKLADTYG